MGWKIIFAPQARARLGEIVQLIAQDDPQDAKVVFAFSESGVEWTRWAEIDAKSESETAGPQSAIIS